MRLIPKFTMEPGDGTGNSIADAQVRNLKNLCIIKDCGKTMVKENTHYFMCGYLCDEHKKSIRDAWEKNVRNF